MAPRLLTALKLYAFAVLGIFLLAAPWTPVWERSILPLAPSFLGPWLEAGWLRGVVSALGVLDLAAASIEAGSLWRDLAREGQERGRG